MVEHREQLPQLVPRSADSHKGDYGRALMIGGSRGMAGAISLAGMGCLKSGAGLVTLAVPDVCLETVAAFEPSYMTRPCPCDDLGCFAATAESELLEWADAATACGCGPGLGRGADVAGLVRQLYTTVSTPIVVDADALNALARQPDGLASAGGPRILTPHPGEFDRLFGERSASREQREERAADLAKQHGVVIVLKGHHTLITDGHSQYHNDTGNAGMATGGSGDVLTGVVTALVCQGMAPLDAARLGVYVHGRAGDLAADWLSQVAMTARDILNTLPEAWRQLQSRQAESA